MARIYADRVMETSTSTGTGNITLAGAVAGHRTFGAVCALGDYFDYAIVAVDSNGVPTGQWESGRGLYTAANVLNRYTVQSNSSNTQVPIDFAAGTKQVYLSENAASILALDAGVGSGGGSGGGSGSAAAGTPYRYYMISRMSTTVGTGVIAFAQLVTRDAAGAVLPITSITSRTSFDGSTTAANLIDTNDSTLWASNSGLQNSMAERLRLDMGTPVVITSLDVRSRQGNAQQTPYAFELFGSVDGVRFVHVGSGANDAAFTAAELTTYNFPIARLDAGGSIAKSPTIKQYKTVTDSVGAVTLDSPPTAGNMLVAMGTHYNNGAPAAGWTTVFNTAGSVTDGSFLATRIAVAGDSATMTPFAAGNGGFAVTVFEIENTNGVMVLPANLTQENVNQNITLPIGVAVDQGLVLGVAVVVQNDETPTVGGGVTVLPTVKGGSNQAGPRSITPFATSLASKGSVGITVGYTAARRQTVMAAVALPLGGGSGGGAGAAPLPSTFTLASGDSTNLTLTADADVGLAVNGGTPPVSDVLRFAYVPIPDKTKAWTATCRMMGVIGARQYAAFGMAAQDTVGGKTIQHKQTEASLAISRWNGLTSYDNNLQTPKANGPWNGWLRLRYDPAVGLIFEASADGKNWGIIWYDTLATLGMANPPDRVGFFAHNNRPAGWGPVRFSVSYWSFTQ